MAKVLISPVASSGMEPFVVEGKITTKWYPDGGKVYYIGWQSFPEEIVTVLEEDDQ